MRRCVVVFFALGIGCGGDVGRNSDGVGLGSGPGSSSGGAGGSATQGSGADSGAPSLDVGSPDDPEPGDCGGEGGEILFTYIWIANTAEGTVSKIDTMTGAEVGRFATGPHHPEGSPSRTSVNQFGDAVVVNRLPGGIAKVAATEMGCTDANANGSIDTSTGPGDVLPWGTDECVQWYTGLPSPEDRLEFGPRAVAWEGVQPEVDPDGGCTMPEPRVWVAYLAEDEVPNVWRLAGDSGAVLDQIVVPWGEGSPYGGAVDGEGDFWMVSESDNHVVEVDADTLAWTNSPPASDYYGVALDREGHVWGGSGGGDGISRFDVAANDFVVIPTPGVTRIRGVVVDRNRHVWGAANEPCALVEVDGNTDTLISDEIELPGCESPVGVSIDVEGFVWVVDEDADLAYKVDPVTHDIALTVGGLTQPYTYSDMTGHALSLVTAPAG